MPSQLTLGVLLALLLSVAGLGFYAKHQTERAATAEKAVQLAAETADAWRLALEQQTARAAQTDQLLADTRQAQDRLRTTTDRRIRDYETAIDGDQSAVAWDIGRVPAVVADRMCVYRDQAAAASTLPEAAGRTAAADTGTACRPRNGDLWRWAERLVEAVERGNEDKSALKAWVDLDHAAGSAPAQ